MASVVGTFVLVPRISHVDDETPRHSGDAQQLDPIRKAPTDAAAVRMRDLLLIPFRIDKRRSACGAPRSRGVGRTSSKSPMSDDFRLRPESHLLELKMFQTHERQTPTRRWKR